MSEKVRVENDCKLCLSSAKIVNDGIEASNDEEKIGEALSNKCLTYQLQDALKV